MDSSNEDNSAYMDDSASSVDSPSESWTSAEVLPVLPVMEFSVRSMAGTTKAYRSKSIEQLRVQIAQHVGSFYTCVVLLPLSGGDPVRDTDKPAALFGEAPPPYAVTYVNNVDGDIQGWSFRTWMDILQTHVKHGDDGAIERAKPIMGVHVQREMPEYVREMIWRLNVYGDGGWDGMDSQISIQVRSLASLEVNLETARDDGQTLIHEVATRGYTETVRALIDSGVNIDVQDDYGRTPLLCAVSKQRFGVVRALLGKNANPLLAVKQQHLRRYERVNCAATPIHEAAHRGCPYIVSLLIDVKVDVNIVNEKGETPLHLAAHQGFHHTVKVLIDANADVNIVNKKGETPLHFAAREQSDRERDFRFEEDGLVDGCREVIHILTRAGANVDMKDDNGRTAFDRVQKRRKY